MDPACDETVAAAVVRPRSVVIRVCNCRNVHPPRPRAGRGRGHGAEVPDNLPSGGDARAGRMPNAVGRAVRIHQAGLLRMGVQRPGRAGRARPAVGTCGVTLVVVADSCYAGTWTQLATASCGAASASTTTPATSSRICRSSASRRLSRPRWWGEHDQDPCPVSDALRLPSPARTRGETPRGTKRARAGT